MEKDYKFEFYFYNEFASNFEYYFKNKSRLTIWNEDNPNSGVPAMFLSFEETKDRKIIGYMKVLFIGETKSLNEFTNKKFYMDAHDIVGHIILLDND